MTETDQQFPDDQERPADENLTGGTEPAGTDGGEAAEGRESPAAEAEADGTAGEQTDPLAAAQEQAADLQDQLARRNADLYNLQEEYNRYVRRSKAEVADHRAAGVQSVAEALLGVLDELELARQHGDLEGPLLAIADKLEGTLESQFAIKRYGAAGDEFDPMIHDALTNMGGAEVTIPTVVQVIQPGYKLGDRVLRAARVAVQSPE